jgi:hypothetical protein
MDPISAQLPLVKIIRLLGPTMLLFGLYLAVEEIGMPMALLFLPLYSVFAYFLGVPAIVNLFRTSEAYASRRSQYAVTFVVQGLAILVMVLVLRITGLGGLTWFFIAAGIINALLMPREDLMKERVELAKSHDRG